ncbi:unnamed protein product [Rangifer tarandus platyrhynchus]|uniref:Uncharacterized protein n=1 Tax=Rangifer tarandus platyrhynchus TaxID=3082113 RepID=A0ABN8Z625_RANTA|nr:unnamed protein product [Rangifer tarandus platyrhynchus]
MALNLFNYSINIHGGASLVVLWLRLRASTSEVKVSIPGQGPCFCCTSHSPKKSWVTDILTLWSFSINKHVKLLSHVPLFVTPWLAAPPPQAPLPMGFSRQEYLSELLFPSPGDPPDPRIEPTSLALKAVSCISGKLFTAGPPGKHVLNPAFPHLIQSLTSVT